MLHNGCVCGSVARNDAPDALSTAQVKAVHYLIQQPRERLPVPQDGPLTPEIHFKNYSCFVPSPKTLPSQGMSLANLLALVEPPSHRPREESTGSV